MNKIVANINFGLNGVYYIKGDEIKIKDINLIRKLNENGFINPLSYEELIKLERELKKEEIKEEV